MNVECPISVGELIDKVTILEIKSKKIKEAIKLKNIKIELELLNKKLKALGILKDSITAQNKDELYHINEKLWEIEDLIREKEHAREFDQKFIELARSVYVTNDERFRVKNLINLRYNSTVKEEKSYKGY